MAIEESYAFTNNSLSNSSPQIIKVTSNIDTSAKGTLRWAINQANATQQQSIIDLSTVTETIQLNQSLPSITTDMIIKGNQNSIISGNNRHRIFQIKQGNITLAHLSLINGLAQGSQGQNGRGGSAGIGGGLLMEGGNVKLDNVVFTNNKAIGGEGSNSENDTTNDSPYSINQTGGRFYVNRGAITGANGISLGDGDPQKLNLDRININNDGGEFFANRGAVAGVNGIGVSGIGAITFAGGGGFGGFGNAGNGGNGGNGGFNGGNGGNGGDGGNGGVGFFGSFGTIDGSGTIGNISFGGGGGFGGFGNAGNGGNGGNICSPAESSAQSNNSYSYGDEDDGTETQSFLDATLDRALEKEVENETDNNKTSELSEDSPELEPKIEFDLLFCGDGGNGGNGGDGGFGGGGGSGGWGGNGGIVGKYGIPGKGGFGGGNGGLGFGGGGAGLGGAIFVKSGILSLENTTFIGNMALGGSGTNSGLGKGGAIFVMSDALKQQASIIEDCQVISVGSLPKFEGNIATSANNLPNDNGNIFGTIILKNQI